MVLTEGLKNTFCRNKQTNKQIHSEKNATKYRWNGDFFPIHRTYFKSSIVCFMFIDINKQTDFHLTSICSWSERNSTENSCYIMVFSTLAKNRSLCVHCSSLWLTKQARHMCNVSHIIFHMLFLCFFIVFFSFRKFEIHLPLLYYQTTKPNTTKQALAWKYKKEYKPKHISRNFLQQIDSIQMNGPIFDICTIWTGKELAFGSISVFGVYVIDSFSFEQQNVT